MVLLFSVEMHLLHWPSEGQWEADAFYLSGHYEFKLCQVKCDPEVQDPRTILVFVKLK